MEKIKCLTSLSFFLLLTSCASIKKAQERAVFCSNQAKDHVYEQNTKELAQHVEEYLLANKFTKIPAMGSGPNGFSTKTSFDYSIQTDDELAVKNQATQDKIVKEGDDILFVIEKIEGNRNTIHAYSKNDPTKRDYFREWLILKRVDPKKAEEIISQADAQIK